MRHLGSATALAVLLAACSSQEPPPPADDAAAPAQAAANGTAPSPTPTSTTSAATESGDTDSATRNTDDDDPTATETASGSGALRQIPATYRGTWARSESDCAARNFNRLTVAADRVSFFEDGGLASDIRGGADQLAVTYPFENPDGVTEKRVVYFAIETAQRMRVRRGTDGESLTYQRC